MERFNINSIIAAYSLDIGALAEVLFPDTKHPKAALRRIITGKSYLTSVQLERLASYIGIEVSELFACDSWKSTSQDGCLVLYKNEFRVKLNYNGTFLTVYKNNDIIEQIILNTQTMSLDELIQYIDNLIKNHTDNGNN